MDTMQSAIFLGVILAVIALGGQECAATDNRIVGGRPAEEGEFPYQVSLRRTYNDKHFCGGSLITENHVLTAAHCMYYRWGGVLPPIVVSVVAGQLNLTITENTAFRNVSKILVHPKFNKTSMENDVAIIKLSSSFKLTHLISTIPLAKNDTHHVECVVSGWGVQQFESTEVSETLLTTQVNRISNERCDSMYGNGTIMPSMMCAYDEAGEHDACQGDSGGPLANSGYLIGVISTGEGCASKEYPGIYASVPYLYGWITDNVHMTNHSESTSETTPNFTEEEISEPTKHPEMSETPQTSNATTSKTTQNTSAQTHTVTHHITTPKHLDDNSTAPAQNKTKVPVHIGDHSRIPDDVDDSGVAGMKGCMLITVIVMSLFMVQSQLFL